MSSTSAAGLTALSSTLLGLSSIAVALRFYARRKQKLQLKSDDWIMIPCLVCAQLTDFTSGARKLFDGCLVSVPWDDCDHILWLVVSPLDTCSITDRAFGKGLHQRVLGYPTPGNRQVAAKTAPMLSKV